MSFAVAERRLRSTSRLLSQGTWLLLVIAAGLMFVVRRNDAAHTPATWVVGAATLAMMGAYALRDIARKLGHRNTEDRLVKDVKAFLENQPPAAVLATDNCLPTGSAGFLPLQGAAALLTSAGTPVVYDIFPSRKVVDVSVDLFGRQGIVEEE